MILTNTASLPPFFSLISVRPCSSLLAQFLHSAFLIPPSYFLSFYVRGGLLTVSTALCTKVFAAASSWLYLLELLFRNLHLRQIGPPASRLYEIISCFCENNLLVRVGIKLVMGDTPVVLAHWWSRKGGSFLEVQPHPQLHSKLNIRSCLKTTAAKTQPSKKTNKQKTKKQKNQHNQPNQQNKIKTSEAILDVTTFICIDATCEL